MAKKLKVVVLTHTMPRFAGDSAAAFMTGLGNGLLASGLDVTFLVPWHPLFQQNPEQKFRTITYHYFPFRSLEIFGYSGSLESDMKIKPFQLLLSPLVIVFGALALVRLIKREKVDVVSAHWLVPNGVIAAIAKLFSHVTTHVSLPGSDVFLAQRNPLIRPFAVWAARNSDLITSNSPRLAADLGQLGVNKTIVPVIYGVDPGEFKQSKLASSRDRSKTISSGGSGIILGVGRLVPKKGFHILLEAFARLQEHTSEVILVLVGDGAERKSLEQQAQKLKIAQRIKFAGTASPAKLRQHYAKANIFVLPSIRDEAGNLDDQSVSVVEAMASELPVVTTDFPGYRLTVNHGKTGYLFKEGSVDELTRYLKKLLVNPKLRRKIGTAARKAVEQEFSWNAIGKQYRKLFENVIR